MTVCLHCCWPCIMLAVRLLDDVEVLACDTACIVTFRHQLQCTGQLSLASRHSMQCLLLLHSLQLHVLHYHTPTATDTVWTHRETTLTRSQSTAVTTAKVQTKATRQKMASQLLSVHPMHSYEMLCHATVRLLLRALLLWMRVSSTMRCVRVCYH
jgi:hypothetical protein